MDVDLNHLNINFEYSLKRNFKQTISSLKLRIEQLNKAKNYLTGRQIDELKWSIEKYEENKHLLPFI